MYHDIYIYIIWYHLTLSSSFLRQEADQNQQDTAVLSDLLELAAGAPSALPRSTGGSKVGMAFRLLTGGEFLFHIPQISQMLAYFCHERRFPPVSPTTFSAVWSMCCGSFVFGQRTLAGLRASHGSLRGCRCRRAEASLRRVLMMGLWDIYHIIINHHYNPYITL